MIVIITKWKRLFFPRCNRKCIKPNKQNVCHVLYNLHKTDDGIFLWWLSKSPHFHCFHSVDQHAANLASCFWFKHMIQNDFGRLWYSRIYGALVCGILITVQQPCRFCDRACLTGFEFMMEIIQNRVIIFPWQLHYHLVLCP